MNRNMDRSDLTVQNVVESAWADGQSGYYSSIELEAGKMRLQGYRKASTMFYEHRKKCEKEPDLYQAIKGMHGYYVPGAIWDQFSWTACAKKSAINRKKISAQRA